MSVAGRLAVLALKPLARGAAHSVGRGAGEGAVGPVNELLAARFGEQAGPLADSLRKAIERAWKAVEVALQGTSWLRQVAANADDRPLADLLKPLVQLTEPEMAKHEAARRLAVSELRAARKKNYLTMPAAAPEGMAAGLARGAALYARFDSPALLLKADRSAVQQAADELKQAGFANLAAVLLPDDGSPLLAAAAAHYFRRAAQDHSPLAGAVPFADDDTADELAGGLDALQDVASRHPRRLEELLGNLQAPLPEPRIASLDLKAEMDQGGEFAELYRDVLDMERRLDLSHTAVRPHDVNLVRNEQERQQIRRLVDRYRAVPEAGRHGMPALQNAVAQLELAAGDVAAAVKDFQGAASRTADPAAQGEAHMNAHRAALQQPDFPTAMKEFLEAVKVDGKRFATFPVGKYLPARVLGAGGFGTAFLCKHKYMNAQVVVKTLSTEGLERDVDEVFSEAQALGAINHAAIIRVQDCGYVDAAKKHRPFLVMDYFDGPTLREYVEKNGPLSVPELLALAEPVAAGLEAAHAKGILHRDIKPANMLVKRLPDQNGKPRWDVKLIDFGLALKQRSALSASYAGKPMTGAGTTDYAAPEQLGAIPGVEAGPPSDIYSFGKTCCYALFQTTAPLPRHWKSLPEPLSDLLERCLNDRPEDRPKDFAIVSRCFARLAQGAGAQPVGTAIAADSRARAAPVPEVPVVPMIVPAARAARHEDEDEDEEDDYIEPPRGGGGKIMLAVLAVLALGLLLVCGGGGGALWYFWPDITGDNTAVANADSGSDSAQSTVPENRIDPNRPNLGGVGVPIGGTAPNFPPPREDKKPQIISFVDVPTQAAADFVIDRIQSTADDAWSPKVLKAEKKGTNVVATVEEKFGSNKIDDWARKLELGLVERDGDKFVVKVTAPPAPSRTPPEVPELPQLSNAQYARVLQALRANQQVRDAITLLKQTSPKEEQRAAIRTQLKLRARDPFDGKDAVEALGIWGTPEDVPFLAALDDGGGFNNDGIIKALGRLRDPAGAAYLSQKLSNVFVGDRAADALRAIGPAAEKDIQAALSSTEAPARRRACKLLKDLGSTASLGVLKSATRDADREVSAAAWEALKMLAFHPSKPVSAGGDQTPVAVKPKVTSTVDDLKVTPLDEAASLVLPNMALAADGTSFYTLDPAGNIRRLDWDGKPLASMPARGMNLMAVSSRGLVMASPSDAKLVDAATLALKMSGPMENARGLTSAPGLDFAVARCEGAIGNVPVIDLGAFTFASYYVERKPPGAKAGTFTVFSAISGKSDPVLSPDGRWLYFQGGGQLHRWSVANFKLATQDTSRTLGGGDGRVVVSPDGKYVALAYPEGSSGTAGVTAILSATDLKKQVMTISHGPKLTALAFDSKGNVYAATDSSSLIRYDADGKKVKEYDLGGKTRQILPNADGTKLLLLTRDKLLRVDLP